MLPLRGEGLIPGQETKIPYAVQCGQKKQNKNKNKLEMFAYEFGEGKRQWGIKGSKKEKLSMDQ